VEGESELRVWNNYGSGGYLEWWGHGRVKVYIDGRTPTVFNEEMMLNEKLSRSRPRLLRSQLNQWNADAVLLGHISVLPIPPGDPEWTLVGFDRESALYLRSQLVRRYSLSGIGFDPFNPWSSFNSLDVDQAIQSLHHMLEQDSDNDLAWQYLGQFLSYGRSHGDDTVLAQAMEAFQHAIELNPANGMARLSLASLQLTTGQAGATAVHPILDQLDDFGPVGFLGVETQVASMLLESGYPQQAINVLSPAEWYRHQQLDADFNVWSLRRKAHSKLGEKEKSDFDRRMEKRLALDLQPDKSR
jgi:tetratricopeptide (TPR) repeat protein